MRLTPLQEQQIKTFKAMADGTRMKMVSAMSKPMTVKQLADMIGEDHHKLYHHMRVLEGAGIVKLVETRTDSHIVEKYYQLMENAMVLNSKEYAPEFLPMLNSMVLELVQTTVQDLLASSTMGSERAAASRIILRCSENKFDEVRVMIQKHMRELLADCQALEEEGAESAYEVMLLHFPVIEAAHPADQGQNGSAVKKPAKKRAVAAKK